MSFEATHCGYPLRWPICRFLWPSLVVHISQCLWQHSVLPWVHRWRDAPNHNPIPDMGAEWLTVCQEPPLSNITIHCTLVSFQTTTVPHNKYILNNNMLVKIWQCIKITDINLIKHYGYVTHGFLFKAITYWGRGKWLPYCRRYFYAIHEWEFCYCVIEYQWKSFPKVQLPIYHQCFRYGLAAEQATRH